MKRTRIRHTFMVLITLAVLATGCFKTVTTDTVIVLKTSVQSTSDEAIHPTKAVLAYGYYDTDTCWTVASYDDARHLRITHKHTRETREIPDEMGYTHYSDTLSGTYTNLDIEREFAMIVVVDTTEMAYGYTLKQMSAVNLEETYLSVIFYNWKTTPYTEGSAGSTDPRTEGLNGKCFWHMFPPQKNQGQQ